MSARIYLGDSVYYELDCGTVILTTQNGLGASNTIALEPEVIVNLVRQIARDLDRVVLLALLAGT